MEKKVKRKMKFGLYLMAVLMVFSAMPVLAKGNAELFMKVKNYQKEEGTVEISCMLEEGDAINNGKLRILYDPKQITLVESKAGDILTEAMSEINDCLTGNKEEGEIVGVFGSARDIPTEGSILDLKFQLGEGVKKGDKITFELKPEKLAGDNGDVSVKVSKTVYTVGDDIEDKTTSTEPPKKGSGGSSTGSAKTGDDTQVVWYILGCGGALVLLSGVVIWKKRQKKS